MQLTLEGVGVELPHGDFSDRKKYAIDGLKRVSDMGLLQLATHFEVESPNVPLLLDADFWIPNMARVFISHLATFKVEASKLQAAFQEYGISAFVAHEDIEPNRAWQSEIEKALETADFMVVMMKPGFHESKWTDQEIGWMLGRHRPIFALRDGCDPYGFIGSLQAISAYGKSEERLAEDLVYILVKNTDISPIVTKAVVNRFTGAQNWAHSKSLISVLEESEYWESEFVPQLKMAVKTNYEVSQSFGVPERVTALIAKRSSGKSGKIA
jgi:hypothetical protein